MSLVPKIADVSASLISIVHTSRRVITVAHGKEVGFRPGFELHSFPYEMSL